MENEGEDVALLLPPVAVTANGVLKIISAYRTGTSEVQKLLGSECRVILECEKCQSLFRSVANFISHKRNYCRKNATAESISQHTTEAYAKIETINTALQRKDIDQIADRLTEKASKVCSDGVVGENKEATERVQYFTSLAEAVKERRAARKEQLISLTPLPGTSQAVAQSVSTQKASPPSLPVAAALPAAPMSTDSTSEDSSLQDERKKSRGRPRKISLDQKNNVKLLSSDSASSSPKACTSSDASSSSLLDKTAPNYCCEKCHAQFTSQKSLNLHESTQHMTTRMQYKCPCCKNSFCNLWSTYRHLKSIHRKTQEQVERMKPVIRKRAFKMTVPVYKATSTSSSPQSSRAASPVTTSPSIVKPKAVKSLLMKSQQELDKAWVGVDNNFTVDVGDHRCGVCGLRFERKAALISHTNTCHRKPASSSATKTVKSPSVESTGVEAPRTKPEGAANRKSSAPMKIVRGVRELKLSPVKPDTLVKGEGGKSDSSPTSVKENKVTNKVPSDSSPTKTKLKSENSKTTPKSLTNGFSSTKKSTLKVPQSMNPVVKLVYSNKNIIRAFPATRRASPNIIKKATAKVFTSNLASKKLAASIKDSIKSKSTLVNNVTSSVLDTSTSEQPKFIKLTPVTMAPNGNSNVLNVKTIIPFTLQKTPLKTYATPKSKTPENVSPMKQEKAEIIVRTVSDKKLSPVKSVCDKSQSECDLNGHDDRSMSSRCSTTSSSPDKSRSGIQVRRDYAKVSLESECSSRPGSAQSLGVSEDEEFNGWDTNNEDDFQGQIGLPQINNMNLVYDKLLSEHMSEYPTSHDTDSNTCDQTSPLKTRGQREASVKRRKITNT